MKRRANTPGRKIIHAHAEIKTLDGVYQEIGGTLIAYNLIENSTGPARQQHCAMPHASDEKMLDWTALSVVRGFSFKRIFNT